MGGGLRAIAYETQGCSRGRETPRHYPADGFAVGAGGLRSLWAAAISDFPPRVGGKQGVTVLLVEQNARMALSIADRAYVMETGRIVMQGPARELLGDEEVKKAYLGT